MNDQAIEQEIQAKGLTAPRITPDMIDALMQRVQVIGHVLPDTTTTVMHGLLDGKFLLGTAFSACVSAENFDEQIGLKIAHEKLEAQVREKLWELEGYRLYRELEANAAG